MKDLRTIRIFLAILLLAAAIGYAFFAAPAHPMTRVVPYTQIVPSMIAYTFGALLFWLVVSLFFGRVYCASFCPIGALQDGVIFFRKRLKPKKHRYHGARRVRYHILIIYSICLVIGFTVVPLLIEPWNIFLNIAALTNPTAVEATWIRLGTGATVGFVGGIITLALILAWAWIDGREFCNSVCPIGTFLSLAEAPTSMRIEIDSDKCVNCFECEETCRASCIEVKSRTVDNSRCVRCFDCVKVCPNNAIRYQRGRNGAATPLMKRTND